MKTPVPKFSSEAEERQFWQTHDSTEFLDWEMAQPVTLPRLRPTTRTMSLRLPEAMIDELKVLANRHDISCQSLVKIYLAERLAKELRPKRAARPRRKS